MASKYEALAEYLSAQPGTALPMTFAQVKAIVGELPASAWERREWWSNYTGFTHSRHGWLAAGWKTAKVDMQAQRLVFVRMRPTQPRLIGERRSPTDSSFPLSLRSTSERPARPEPQEPTPGEVAQAAGGEANLAEVARAIERYLAGEVTESELGRVVRKHWGRRG